MLQRTGEILVEQPVPVVFNLSRAFNDQLGDGPVAELVEMLNQVDTASRQSLQELNEANWVRFERRLGDFSVDIARLENRFTSQLISQMHWMIGIWLTVLLAVIGLWLRR